MRWRKEQPEAAPEGPPAGSPYEGPHIFGSDGWHYPIMFDPDGNELGPDKSRPLVVKGGQLLHAEPDDVSHFHAYGLNEKELELGSED